MTVIALLMLYDSEKDYEFRVFLYETDPSSKHDYSNWVYKTFKDVEPYNCCRLINQAYSEVTSDWVIIANNDLRFERGWFSKIVDVHNKRPDIESFSPKDPLLYSRYYDYHFVTTDDDYVEGYKVTEFMAGWCYVMKKRVWDAIYPWDEQFNFYYADNDYAEKIKSLGIKHALVRDSIVFHFGSQTIAKQSDSSKLKEDELKFRKKWNQWD
jgi:GT2 family glycosyltransferase